MSKEQQQPNFTPETTPPPKPGKRLKMATTLGICATGWFFPGASHLFLGRWGRAIAFTVSVLTMFGLGLVMQGRLYDFAPEQPLHIFAFLANVGVGIPYLVAQQLGLGTGFLNNPSYDYGSTYLWVSGLLNYLIVLDAFDIAQGRKL
jgi:hypothetical protein